MDNVSRDMEAHVDGAGQIDGINVPGARMQEFLDQFQYSSLAKFGRKDIFMKYTYFKPHAYDNSQTVVSLLEKSMQDHRDKTALVCQGRSLSYSELEMLSGKITRFLQQQGVGKEKVVSILLHRSEMMIVAAIGALRAGAAYQPLDPSYPDDRLAFMVSDAEAMVLITEEGLRQRLPDFGGAVLDIGELGELSEGEGKDAGISPADLFILLYTSGSTGIPKGVMLEHRNLVAFIDWYTRYYSLNGESRVAAYASFGFDASMMDTYPILCTGGQLHIISEDIRMDFPKLHAYFEEQGITHSFITTQVGRQYARLYPESASLKYLSVGGETLVPVAPPKYAFYNAYGPTECTIFSTTFQVDQLYKSVPIGYPLDNLRVYVVDEAGNQVENGTEGELWISGPQVGRGYLKRPEKTAQVFRRNPFSEEPGYDRVYCTGDIVRGLDDGRIEFVGRRDGQVKIRGFRIELPEIEEVIRRFPGVQDATVAAFDKPAGGKYIVAYVVAEQAIDIEALHAFIARTKPPYMVPAFTLQIDSIPLNQNQKVDKKRLPVPEYSQEGYEAPETETEKMLCEKMALALGLDMVGANDDFFQIGGDSLSTIMLITECSHPGVNTSSIYQYRTPRALAAYCDSLGGEEDIRAANEAAMKREHALAYQHMLYLKLQKDNPEALYCNNPFLFQLADGIDLERMREAVNRVLAHHPALRTRLILNAQGEYRQVYDESLFAPLCITDLSEEEFELGKDSLVRPFALMGGCFWRGGFYRTPAAAYLFLDFHHIIFDGFSLRLLLDEFYACYENPGHELAEDFYFYLLEAPLRARGSRNSEEAAAYCQKLFHGPRSLTETEMSLKPDREARKGKGAVKTFPLAADKSKFRGNVACLTACALAICAYNGSDRAVVRCTHYGRNDRYAMSSVGLFANYYPIMLVREAGDTRERLIAKVQEQVSFIEAHLDYPYFEGHVKEPERIVRFIYQQDSMSLGDFAGLIKHMTFLDNQDHDMTDSYCGISVIDNSQEEKLIFLERYARDCYEEASMDRLHKLFCEAVSYLAGE